MTLALAVAAVAAAAVLALLQARRSIGEGLAGRLDRAARDLESLERTPPPGVDPATVICLRAQCAHLQWRLPGQRDSRKDWLLRAFRREVVTLEAALEEVRAGRDPLAGASGIALRALRSPVDGDLAVYSLRVPADYAAGRAWPLIVHLHGRGPLEPFTGHPAPDYGAGILVAAPYGRGAVDFMGPAEADVLAVVDEVARLYSVDPDRVYLAGASMGGTGAWHLAVHYPERFAALVAASANSDDRVWEELWEGGARQPAAGSVDEALKRLERLDSPVTYAGNLLHVAVRAVHGDDDQIVPVGHARSMVEALRAAGAAVEYQELAGVGHDVGYGEMRLEQAEWLLGHRREARPRRVRYATDGRWSGAYWLKRVEPDGPLSLAEVAAEVRGPAAVSVVTSNCGVLEIDLAGAPLEAGAGVSVTVDGREFGPLGRAPARFVRGPEGWRSAPSLPPRPPGEFARVFWGPFAVVYGTRSADPELNAALRREAGRLAGEWRRRFFCSPRLLSDTEVGDEVLGRCSLVLFGGPGENALTARALRELRGEGREPPFDFVAGSAAVRGLPAEAADPATLGLQFVWASPFSPERAIAVVWGASWRALVDVNGRFGNTFDWTVYENRQWFGYALYDDRTAGPETFLRVGCFGPDGRIDRRWSWARPAGGADGLPGRAPVRLSAADCPEATLWLDSLVPAEVRQLRGPVGFGRGWGGVRLSAGREGRQFEHGLGTRAPSEVVFALGGRFRRFRATVGADLGGRRLEDLSAPRVKHGAMRFLVRGDGRPLYAGDPLGPADPPADIDIDVTGVDRLRLEVSVAGKYDWHLGPAAWGDARVEK